MRRAWLVALAAAAAGSAGPAVAATCERVGVNPFDSPRLTRDGSLVVFVTNAALVPQDTNRTIDVYAQPVRGGKPELVSVGTDGRGARGRSGWPAVSSDGRFVAGVLLEFTNERGESWEARSLIEDLASSEIASLTLAPGDDGEGRTDVFVRDRLRRRTALVSVTPRGRSGNGASSRPDISPDGRYVAFQSHATDLARGDRNALPDVYVRDLTRRTTTLVSALPGGRPAEQLGSTAPSISGNGLVAFDTTEATRPGRTAETAGARCSMGRRASRSGSRAGWPLFSASPAWTWARPRT